MGQTKNRLPLSSAPIRNSSHVFVTWILSLHLLVTRKHSAVFTLETLVANRELGAVTFSEPIGRLHCRTSIGAHRSRHRCAHFKLFTNSKTQLFLIQTNNFFFHSKEQQRKNKTKLKPKKKQTKNCPIQWVGLIFTHSYDHELSYRGLGARWCVNSVYIRRRAPHRLYSVFSRYYFRSSVLTPSRPFSSRAAESSLFVHSPSLNIQKKSSPKNVVPLKVSKLLSEKKKRKTKLLHHSNTTFVD